MLTEQEAQREVANSILFTFMDFLSMCAFLVVVFKPESCDKPLHTWYAINGAWAAGSFCYTIYYTLTQLKHNYQTNNAIAITYIFEGGYLALSIWAWIILSGEDGNGECT